MLIKPLDMRIWKQWANISLWAGWLLLLLPLALAACNDMPSPPPTDVPLNQLPWCTSNHTLIFQDTSQPTPTALNTWAQVKPQLGFTTYLPQMLPKGTCLVSGEAQVHDKILGSTFGVTYLLPSGSPLAFSETQVSNDQTIMFQCSTGEATPGPGTPTAAPSTPTPTPGPGTPTATPAGNKTLQCLGQKGQTTIVIVSDQTQKYIQATFNSLQPDVDWVPKS
jgi:hypothetical protein